MKQQSHFHSEEQQQEAQKAREQAQPLEFATPEALLRHDAGHTPVPPAIADRLQESVSHIPAPGRSWWRRLLGL